MIRTVRFAVDSREHDDADGQVYPIGNTVPAALRPIVLADRPAQVAV